VTPFWAGFKHGTGCIEPDPHPNDCWQEKTKKGFFEIFGLTGLKKC
jgi:hypothetical protein